MKKWILVMLGLYFNAAMAVEVADVQLADKLSLDAGGKALVLNGAGVRKKFFFSIYVGALYLEEKSNSMDAVINQSGPKRVAMHFLYDEVSAKKINAAWVDGFKDNHTEKEMAGLQERLEQFQTLFGKTVKGDIYWLDYLPGTGTRVTINGQLKGTIPGQDFYNALLRIWIGESPITGSLKKAMLGG